MQHTPKQLNNVRCPALDVLRDSLCGPLTQTFGDSWSMALFLKVAESLPWERF